MGFFESGYYFHQGGNEHDVSQFGHVRDSKASHSCRESQALSRWVSGMHGQEFGLIQEFAQTDKVHFVEAFRMDFGIVGMLELEPVIKTGFKASIQQNDSALGRFIFQQTSKGSKESYVFVNLQFLLLFYPSTSTS